jgi:glucose/arabinose dehydrogenase
MLKVYGICALLVFSECVHTVLYGQTYPADFAQVLVANTIANPTAMAFAPDGRIFVAEQSGRLRVIKNGTLLPTPFLQLTVSSTGERGLIGITLDPDFLSNQHIYLYYTVPGTPAHNRISRFTGNGDVVLPNSESIVLELDPLSNATNHNGGAMQFGKEGQLYVAVGENANSSYAQNLDTYHGKILRINKDGSIPAGNPFPTGSEQRKRVWAYGLRNPFTFSIHPESGRILVNDVGQVAWEEVNDATQGGKNFGWPTTEGKFNPATYPALTNPIYAYPQAGGDGNGCAITGGIFFYPSSTNYPSIYFNKYFIQDFCNRWINYLDVSVPSAMRSSFATSIAVNGVALSVGTDGNLYYLSRGAGALYKIIYNKTTTPYITQHPSSITVAEGQAATFTVSSLGSNPMQYQWQKNGSDIPNATNSTYTFNVSSGDEGAYRVMVSNAAGSVASNVATLTVIDNALPTATIITPLDSSFYTAGSKILFSGTGTDQEDGDLPLEAFEWQVDFHHDTHKHDEPAIVGIAEGEFAIPDEGETSDNVWYTIILTVTDSRGSTAKDSVRIIPRKSVIALTTDPPGLEILIDGQPFPTPVEITSVEGMKRSFGVVTPQIANGKEFEFEAWSNAGDIVQVIPTPVEDMSLTARFTIVVDTETNNLSAGNLTLFPNPAAEHCEVQFSVNAPQAVSIRLVNILGQEVLGFNEPFATGRHSFIMNVGQTTSGIYYVMIGSDGRRIAKKLVISKRN